MKKMVFSAMALVVFTATSFAGDIKDKNDVKKSISKQKKRVTIKPKRIQCTAVGYVVYTQTMAQYSEAGEAAQTLAYYKRMLAEDACNEMFDAFN